MRPEDAVEVLQQLRSLEAGERRRVLARMSVPGLRSIAQEWWWQAHGGQQEPEPGWRVWTIVAGRGFGKTRAGAEWVSARAREMPEARIALVGASIEEVERVMIRGPSGLLSIARSDEAPVWTRSRRVVEFSSGALAFAYGAERPDGLRGPEHHFAWADELAKWRHPQAAWDVLQMGLRLGKQPRALVTTTPRAGRAGALLKRIGELPGTVVTRGRMAENPHLPDAFRAAMEAIYGGTRLGRQELGGELIEDVEGSLWPREMMELCRSGASTGELRRVVVGVDPPASADGDACGIVVCGIDDDGVGHVLADCTVAGLRPEGWARAVARAAERWGADRVVAEKNNGGDMVESVLRSVDEALPVKLVSASRSKEARAEPVAARFEAGMVKLAGRFPELEDELAAMTAGGYSGAGSPDRADACVWALSELMLKERREPRIVAL